MSVISYLNACTRSETKKGKEKSFSFVLVMQLLGLVLERRCGIVIRQTFRRRLLLCHDCDDFYVCNKQNPYRRTNNAFSFVGMFVTLIVVKHFICGGSKNDR